MYGPVAPDLARHTANRIRQATLAYLNTRVEPGLSASCFGGRADATRRGTDRRAVLVRFRSLIRDGGRPWVAKSPSPGFWRDPPRRERRSKSAACVGLLCLLFPPLLGLVLGVAFFLGLWWLFFKLIGG